MRRIALALILLLPAAALAQPAPQAIPVGVVTIARHPVNAGTDFVGRVEAMQKVDLRARVTGFLESVDFQEGRLVKEGDTLFHIEREPFVAAQMQARGSLMQAQSQLANATVQLQRAQELMRTSAGSVATRDDRQAAQLSAQGAAMSADADLRTATINLGYTIITAPISGRIGRTALTKGNVVSPQSGVLATIVSLDPVYLTFPVSERDLLHYRREGNRAAAAASLVVRLRFADGSLYNQVGHLDFLDTSVDRGTDTITARAQVPNPDGVLVDGQFVRVRVQGVEPEQALLVPQAALLTDQQGSYVFVVENGHAVARRLTTGADVGRDVVVQEGLREGEQVVVEGLMALRAGAAVLASPAKGI
jgi:membrane fusion protein (multidrug efflux system)